MSRIAELSSFRRMMLMGTVVIVLTVLLALLAEITVRVRHYLKFGDLWGVESTFTVDSESGLRIPIPNSEFGSIRINSLGFRSPEIAVPKPRKTIRMAFIGASTTYCAEVSDNSLTWPHQVHAALQKSWPGVDMDYVNAGVPGYGASTSLRNLEHRVSSLDPDIIVIYHATNDLSSNSYDLAVRAGLAQERTEQGLTWPSRYSLLWYLSEKNFKIWLNRLKANNNQDKLVFDVDELSAPFRRDLLALVNASKIIADQVVLVTFATHLRSGQTPQQQSRAANTSLYYMPYMSIGGLLEGFNAYNQVIRDVAKESGALLLDTETAIPGDAVHFHDSVHLTDTGSKAVAAFIARTLTESAEIRKLVMGTQSAIHTRHTRKTLEQ